MILLDSKGKQGAGMDAVEEKGESEEKETKKKAKKEKVEETPVEEDQDPLEEDLPF